MERKIQRAGIVGERGADGEPVNAYHTTCGIIFGGKTPDITSRIQAIQLRPSGKIALYLDRMAHIFQRPGHIGKYRVKAGARDFFKATRVENNTVRVYRPFGVDASLALVVSVYDPACKLNFDDEAV